MFKTLIAVMSFFSCVVFSLTAQEMNVSKSFNVYNGYFDHLDVSASIGTPGIGLDLSAPVGKYIKLRTGITYMPRVEVNSGFRVQVGDSLERKYDKQGNRIETKFDKLSGLLENMYGFKVDDEVQMNIKPTYYNFRFLVDILPFRDKRWHFTAGFYYGSSELGRASNSAKDMPSLMAVNMYNLMYDRLMTGEPLFSLGDPYTFDLPPEYQNLIIDKFKVYGRMGIHVGDYTKDGPILYKTEILGYMPTGEPIYDFDENDNPILDPTERDENGNPKLAYHKGDPYMMVPDPETGMVRVTAKSRKFKPYVGFGYGGSISKDGLTELSFDAGVLFWGGVPNVYLHDGIDLTKDVDHVRGKVGSYVRAIKAFPLFPVIELRVTRRIF